MADTQSEQRLSELLSDLMRGVKFFFQQELQLFKSEISLKFSQAGKDLALIAVGGAMVYAGVLVLLIAATLALALVIPAWASALIIGIVAIGMGYALLQRGMNDLKHMNASPTQTIKSLKETKEWITHAIN